MAQQIQPGASDSWLSKTDLIEISSRPGSQALNSLMTDEPEAGFCLLPGGYVTDDGTVHREALLRPLTGFAEDKLAAFSPNSPAARIVTALLKHCLVRIGPFSPVPHSIVSELLVGDREYLLIKLREMSLGTRVNAIIRCSNTDCAIPMDVTFSIDSVDVEPKPVTQRFFTRWVSRFAPDGDRREIEFRLPTGADQEGLAELFCEDKAAGVIQLLARCLCRIGELKTTDLAANWAVEIAGLPETARHEVETEIERLAPKAIIELESVCPECGTTCSAVLDFTALFLAEIRSGLFYLEHDVHLLAFHYHWSERDVLALTRRKRKRYVELVQDEMERSRAFV